MDDIIDDNIDVEFDSPQARMEMRKRHLRFALLAQEIALAGLLELKAKLDQGLPLNMTEADAHNLLDLGQKLERRAALAGKREHDDGDDAPIPPASRRKLQ
jgi:hypothetical protein